VVGVATALDLPEALVSDESLRRWEERLGSLLRRAAEEGPDRPLVVSGLEIAWANDEERRLLAEASVRAAAGARADGVTLQTVFVAPAIAGADQPEWAGIVDRDRNHTATTQVWTSLP